MQRLPIVLIVTCLALAGCWHGSTSTPPTAASSTVVPVAPPLVVTVLPTPPLDLSEPPPESSTMGDREVRTLDPDILTYLSYQARAKGNHAAETQFQYWAVANGGGSQYNLACGYALTGQVDAALYWLQRAAREDGVDADHADKDSDLEILRADSRWPVVATYLRECGAYWRNSDVHDEILILPEGYSGDEPIPILIGLHGKGTSAKEFNSDRYPAMATQLDAAILLVSGAEPIGPRSFVWSQDQERNSARVEQALQAVAERVNVSAKKVMFGFSQGATASVEIAALHPDKYAGAISLSAGSFDELRRGRFARHSEHANQAYVLVCGDDEHPITVATTKTYADIVRDLGASVTHKEYPGIRQHSFPPDFDEQFPVWVREILAANN